MSKNTNKYGSRLERYVTAEMECLGVSVKMGSKGGSAGNQTASDIFTDQMQIECKRRNEDGKETNTIIQRKWWKKVSERAGMNGKIPAVITSEQNIQEAMITLRLRDFLQLTDPWEI